MGVKTLWACIAGLGVIACGGNTGPSLTLPGTYVASVFRVTPTGQALIDVLAAGGTLSITVASDNSTTGSLSIPASLNAGTPFIADMAGTATLNGSSVHFQQASDSFVKDLTWTLGTNLTVNQTISGATYTITLTRQ
jgi:hypothetical protein